MTVVMSSHLISDLQRVCDHIILLARARTQLCDDIDLVSARHAVLTSPSHEPAPLEPELVISRELDGDELRLLARLDGQAIDGTWTVGRPPLEEIVLAYMSAAEPGISPIEAGAA